MVHKNRLAMAVSLMVLGTGALAVPAQTASKQCATEDCACEEALNKNTVEALEEFLRKYPDTAGGTSACAALAVPPDGDMWTPEGQSQDDGSTTIEPAGIPSEV